MWYRLAQNWNYFGTLNRGRRKKTRLFAEDDDENIETNELPNVEDNQEIGEEVVTEEQPLIEVPTQVESDARTPVGVENRKPVPIIYPPGFIVPPVHEFCHCEIQTLPSGQQIWKLGNGENHCIQCVENMKIFNSLNEQAYNEILR